MDLTIQEWQLIMLAVPILPAIVLVLLGVVSGRLERTEPVKYIAVLEPDEDYWEAAYWRERGGAPAAVTPTRREEA